MENFLKKILCKLTLSRIVMASIIIFLLFYFWGVLFQTKDTVEYVNQEQKIQEIKDKNNEKHFRKTFEYGSSELVWFLNEGKFYPFYKVGVDIRLKSVQK